MKKIYIYLPDKSVSLRFSFFEPQTTTSLPPITGTITGAGKQKPPATGRGDDVIELEAQPPSRPSPRRHEKLLELVQLSDSLTSALKLQLPHLSLPPPSSSEDTLPILMKKIKQDQTVINQDLNCFSSLYGQCSWLAGNVSVVSVFLSLERMVFVLGAFSEYFFFIYIISG